MTVETATRPYTGKRSNDVLLSQFARLLGQVAELEQTIAALDDIIDDTRLIALNAALEARRSEAGGETFSAIAAQLNQAVDRLTAVQIDMTDELGELKAEVGEGPACDEVADAESY